MNITADVQKLEPGNKVQLIEVDGSEFDGPILRFHAYNLPHTPEEIEQSNGDIKPKPISMIPISGGVMKLSATFEQAFSA